jgi:hypothetical protein
MERWTTAIVWFDMLRCPLSMEVHGPWTFEAPYPDTNGFFDFAGLIRESVVGLYTDVSLYNYLYDLYCP